MPSPLKNIQQFSRYHSSQRVRSKIFPESRPARFSKTPVRDARQYVVIVREDRMSGRRSYPDHMYVPVPVLTKGAALVVGAICALAIATAYFWNFVLVDPFAAVIGGISSATFYLMGHIAEGQRRDGAGPT